MVILSGKPVSYWIDSTPENNFSPFVDNLLVDVAIVGAGIAGLTAATLLKRAGKTVAVIESKQIATGTSGHTTAKVTSLHQLIYADIIEQLGKEKARIYAESNQAAIDRVAQFVEEEQIECDFSRQSAYTFAEFPEDLQRYADKLSTVAAMSKPITNIL